MLNAREAVAAGLVDRILPFQDLLDELVDPEVGKPMATHEVKQKGPT